MKSVKFTLWACWVTIIVLAIIVWLGSGLEWQDVKNIASVKWREVMGIAHQEAEKVMPEKDLVPDSIDDALKKKAKDIYEEDKEVVEDLLNRF